MSVTGLWEAGNGQLGSIKGSRGIPQEENLGSLMTQQSFSVRSLLRHDVVEVAGLTSFSFGEDNDCRYVMIFKKVKGLNFSLSSLTFSACSPHTRGRGMRLNICMDL